MWLCCCAAALDLPLWQPCRSPKPPAWCCMADGGLPYSQGVSFALAAPGKPWRERTEREKEILEQTAGANRSCCAVGAVCLWPSLCSCVRCARERLRESARRGPATKRDNVVGGSMMHGSPLRLPVPPPVFCGFSVLFLVHFRVRGVTHTAAVVGSLPPWDGPELAIYLYDTNKYVICLGCLMPQRNNPLGDPRHIYSTAVHSSRRRTKQTTRAEQRATHKNHDRERQRRRGGLRDSGAGRAVLRALPRMVHP